MRAMLVAVLVLVGCGGGEDRPAVDGVWILHRADACAVGLTINGASYTFQLLCLLQGGGAGTDIELGDFQADAAQLGFAPRRASCSEGQHVNQVFRYSLKGDELSLIDDEGIVSFKRSDAAGMGGGALAFGCWNDDGTFTPSPIRDL